MAAGSFELVGGKNVEKALKELAAKIGRGGAVSVGFIDKARYTPTDPRGKPRKPQYVAQVAFWNEFGTSRAPARPFFRGMIVQQSPTWGDKLASNMKRTGNDTQAALGLLGENIQAALVRSIGNWPADNAPGTVAIKKFNKGLIDSGTMRRHVGMKVIGSGG